MTVDKKEASDGLEDIVLAKRWNKCKIGSTVRVDPVRAKWLIDHDFGSPAEVVTNTKRSK